MKINFSDIAVCKLFNMLGVRRSGNDIIKLMQEIKNVENTPASLKWRASQTLIETLQNKAGTKNIKLKDDIDDFLLNYTNLKWRSINAIKTEEYVKNKETQVIPNKKDNDLLTEKTVTDNESRCYEIAQKIFAINKGSLMNRMIETACYDEGIPLNSSPDFIAMRNKEVSGINQIVDSINADQKLRDNSHEDTELALADQVIHLQTATKGSPKLTFDIDKILAERQARTEIIMAKAEYYLTNMPHNLDEVSKSLIYEYKNLKVVEAKKTDSQRSENKTDEI
ncbi:hypothetical protein EJP617_09410 [Erwinia sp. Ejp617]|nr:hypothetical protein [Erwinia sp. Ejp617]ADP10622.1 hypothetical protein EJP617_09410 [Erwinia sp. Ejp617]